MHNDLHRENILIDELEVPTTVAYRIPEGVFHLTLSKIARIYDYDNAYYPPLGKNPAVNENTCSKFGMCDNYDERYDLYLVLAFFKHRAKWFKPHFDHIVKMPELQNPKLDPPHYGRLYNQIGTGSNKIDLTNSHMLDLKSTLLYLLRVAEIPLESKPRVSKELVFTHPEV